ncbi:hypothetical protein H6F51_10670 [Cyanobacteria bacterium FACHB-DQ100]|nr:hypothetical protein [Cyanobacteria bacterium FACHB-DQ100]
MSPAHAQTRSDRTNSAISTTRQSSLTTIELHAGHGVSLDFRPTRETIRKAWLDDPSQVTLDFDDAICQNANRQNSCTASVIHLRRIQRLKFPNLPATATTLLTVMSDRNLYTFRLTFPNSGSPRYSAIAIQPNRITSTSVATRIRGSSGAELIEQGLQVAAARRLISRRDALWNRLESLITLVRNGVQVADAARQVGVSQQLIARLVEMGLKTQSV